MRARSLLLPLLVVCSCAAAALLYEKPLTPSNPRFNEAGDHHHYLAMASGQADRTAPFCWRVGLPLAARALSAVGLPLWSSFALLAFLATAGAGLFIFTLIRRTPDLPHGPWLALILYCTLPVATLWPLWDFWLPDAAMLFIVSAGLWAITRRRDVTFLLLVFAGAFVKESALLLLLLHYGMRADRVTDPRAAARSVLLCLPGMAVLAALRLFIQQDGTYTLVAAAQEALSYRASMPWPTLIARLTILPLGALLPLGLLGAWKRRDRALRLLPFIAAVYAQILLARNVERMVVLAAPPLVLLALTGLVDRPPEEPPLVRS